MPTITAAQSGAFIERFTLPPTGDGPLAGLTFAVKDLIDVAGHRTGCGNPDWLATHPPAHASAVCVEQLLAAGAQYNEIADKAPFQAAMKPVYDKFIAANPDLEGLIKSIQAVE